MRLECGSLRRREAEMARKRIFWILLLMLPIWAVAQSMSGTYRLQEEDTLTIAVFDEQQIQAVVVVMPDGNITPPFAGPIRAIGKTTTELEAELAAIYTEKLKLRNPKVSVSLTRIRRILANIGGSVQKPGVYEMRPGQTVRDLVIQGEASELGGDLRHATFSRKGWTESIPIDLYSMLQNNDLSQNYEVKDGDSILVPQKENQYVRIFGEVYAPKSVNWEEGMNLVTALTSAGGVIQTRAKQTKILVIRPREGSDDQYLFMECNLVDYSKKHDFSQNINLKPGDTVFVPNNGNWDFNFLGNISNAIFILDRFGIKLFGG